jgi:hypothetical protein
MFPYMQIMYFDHIHPSITFLNLSSTHLFFTILMGFIVLFSHIHVHFDHVRPPITHPFCLPPSCSLPYTSPFPFISFLKFYHILKLAYINNMRGFIVMIPYMCTVCLEQVHPSILLPFSPLFKQCFVGFITLSSYIFINM